MANLVCKNCNGRGLVPVETDETCKECEGTGHENKAWTFVLTGMEIVESAKGGKGRHGTTIRFVSEGGGIEVALTMDDEWPIDRPPPAVGSHYGINFRSLDEGVEE